jgi:hypothetical protein
MKKQTLLMLLLSGALILTLLFAGSMNVGNSTTDTLITWLEPDTSCDLQRTDCSLQIADGAKVTLLIDSRPIPMVKPFQIKVKISDQEVQEVAVDFKGITMDMGPNNVTLKHLGAGEYAGKGILPVCVRNHMDWRADVYIKTAKGIVVAPFLFASSH